MSIRWYIMPVVGTWRVGAFNDSRRPKFMWALNTGGYSCGMLDYGPEGWCISHVRPAPATIVHDAMVADPEVFAFPQNLDTRIPGSSLNELRQRLALAHVPAHWISASMSFRALLDGLVKYCHWAQITRKVAGLKAPMLTGDQKGRYDQLPEATRNAAAVAATRLKLDPEAARAEQSLENALHAIVEQDKREIRIVEES